DTQDAALDLIVKQARDAVTTFLTRGFVEAKIAEVQAEAGIPVRDVEATLDYVSKQLRFTQDQQATILTTSSTAATAPQVACCTRSPAPRRPSPTPTTPTTWNAKAWRR
ncbi:MAG: hypothetical protein ACRDSN_05485, partial [Pseudonocardiaceae bacterium]